jgi:hypothetical protein
MRLASADALLRSELAEPGTTPGGEFRVNHLFRPDLDGGLQAYLVRSHSPAATVGIHFHVVDQFQLFVEGGGTFQRHAVAPVTLHYTDAHTTYGPIIAGENGLSFMVLRREPDGGANYMPGARDRRERRPPRSVSKLVPAIDGASGSAVLVADDPDGLAGGVIELAPGGELFAAWSGAERGAGQYLVVLEGSLLADAVELAPLSCVWLDAGEEPVGIFAGRGGCSVALLRFPLARAHGGAASTEDH